MIRRLLYRPLHISSNSRLVSLHHRAIYNFSVSIQLNDSFTINDENDIKSEIDAAFEKSSFEGIITLAEDSFDKQDFNITALSYQKLFNLYDQDPTNDYFSNLDSQNLYDLYYRFICTLHLLKDYDSAKYYIQEVVIPKFGENEELIGKLYGIFGLILKEGYNDIESAEKYFKKSIELKPGIENLFSYLNYSAILYNKDDIDWEYLYQFSLNGTLSFASYDAYIVAQHGITCTALNKYDEAEKCLNDVLNIYENASIEQEKDENKGFISNFPDLSHISLRCLLQILCQYWFDNKMDERLIEMNDKLENDYYNKKIWISKYLLQFISPIISEMYWINKDNKPKAIECIFDNKLLLEQEEYFSSLKYIHSFKYWAELNNLNCVDVLQHNDLIPFYFGSNSVLNGLFEHNQGQLLSAKYAFQSIPKEKVQVIYDQIDKFKDEEDYQHKENMIIFNYINKLMEQMFHDTLGKIAKVAWGNISLYQFETASKIADDIIKFDENNLVGFGISVRINTEQENYEKAIEIFETNITEQKCKEDEMLYFNLMPYYGISLCFMDDKNRKAKGEEIMIDLMSKLNKDKESDNIHIIHKEQIYRWYGYKCQYIDKDYNSAIEFYNKSFIQNELIKYPPVQLDLVRCYLEIGDIDKAKENLNEAYENGQEIFGDILKTQYDSLSKEIENCK